MKRKIVFINVLVLVAVLLCYLFAKYPLYMRLVYECFAAISSILVAVFCVLFLYYSLAERPGKKNKNDGNKH